MAVRKDIDIDWALSPRIITVLSPSTDITIQDLHDTLSTLEARFDAMDEPRIFSTGGKEFLDDNTNVGLTMTLFNALLGFQALPGPNFTQVRVGGGNLVAQDALGDPVDPIQTTAFTQVVRTSSSSATLSNQEALELVFDDLEASVAELVKAAFNKMITDPDTGTITIYEDDNVTPFKSGLLFEDDDGTQPYRGSGAERRDRMT